MENAEGYIFDNNGRGVGLLMGLPVVLAPSLPPRSRMSRIPFDVKYFRSNNWRRLHGYPLRRKGKGRKKKRPVLSLDEGWTLLDVKGNPETDVFLKRLLASARTHSSSPSIQATQTTDLSKRK